MYRLCVNLCVHTHLTHFSWAWPPGYGAIQLFHGIKTLWIPGRLREEEWPGWVRWRGESGGLSVLYVDFHIILLISSPRLHPCLPHIGVFTSYNFSGKFSAVTWLLLHKHPGSKHLSFSILRFAKSSFHFLSFKNMFLLCNHKAFSLHLFSLSFSVSFSLIIPFYTQFWWGLWKG